MGNLLEGPELQETGQTHLAFLPQVQVLQEGHGSWTWGPWTIGGTAAEKVDLNSGIITSEGCHFEATLPGPAVYRPQATVKKKKIRHYFLRTGRSDFAQCDWGD